MKIAFVDNSDVICKDSCLDQDHKLVRLDKEWMKKRNNFIFKLSVDRVLKKIDRHEYDDMCDEITQDRIIDEYDRMRSFINKTSFRQIIKFVIEKPTYILIFLSTILALICFTGKIFLYGYYFNNSADAFTGLLTMCLNPIPIDIFSSALIGTFMIIYTFLILGSYRIIISKIENKFFKFLLCILITALIAFFASVIFSNFDGRTFKFKYSSLIFYMILPAIIFIQFFPFEVDIERGSLMFSSIGINFIILLLLVLFKEKFKYIEWILTSFPLIILPLSKIWYSILNKIFPYKDSNMVQEIYDRSQINFVEYKKFSYRITFSFTILVSLLIIIVYFASSAVYLTGKLYSDISVNQYSIITIFNDTDKMQKLYFGTIIGEKNDSYYVSTNKKSLLILKTNNLVVEDCEYFENPTNEKDFEERIEYMKNYIHNNINKNYTVEFVNLRQNTNLGYHHIVSPDKNIEINIYYSTNFMNEMSSISICSEFDNNNLMEDKNFIKIKDKYIEFFGMQDVSMDKSTIYLDNGILTYGCSEENSKYIETYKFESIDTFWEE